MTTTDAVGGILWLLSSVALLVGLFALVPAGLRRLYESRLLEAHHNLHLALLNRETKPSDDAWELLSAIEDRLRVHRLITPAYAFGARWAYRKVRRPSSSPSRVDRWENDEHLGDYARHVAAADRAMVTSGSVSGWLYTLWKIVGGPTPNPQELVGLILRLEGPPPRNRSGVRQPA